LVNLNQLYSGGGRCTVGEVRTRASDENGGFGKTMTWSNGRKDLAFFHFCIGWLTARFLVRSCDLQVVRLADPPRQTDWTDIYLLSAIYFFKPKIKKIELRLST